MPGGTAQPLCGLFIMTIAAPVIFCAQASQCFSSPGWSKRLIQHWFIWKSYAPPFLLIFFLKNAEWQISKTEKDLHLQIIILTTEAAHYSPVCSSKSTKSSLKQLYVFESGCYFISTGNPFQRTDGQKAHHQAADDLLHLSFWCISSHPSSKELLAAYMFSFLHFILKTTLSLRENSWPKIN